MKSDEAKPKEANDEVKECTHPSVFKEYDGGFQTGDYKCSHCGEIVPKPRDNDDGPKKK